MIIGGAALNRDVEQFLRRINFPFTVGYGMTECGPLISYAPWNETRIGSCGRIVDRMEGRLDENRRLMYDRCRWVHIFEREK